LPLLETFDLEAFGTEYQPGQDEAEFDFSNFRFARIERLQNVRRPTRGFREEALLEYDHQASRAPSPRLDAAHVSSATVPAMSPMVGMGLDLDNPWLTLLDPLGSQLTGGQFSWLPEVGELQTGDPDEFWRQLAQ
jgi:hypothetical protein